MIIWAASPAGHEFENGDVITPEALQKAMEGKIENLPLVHGLGGKRLGTVKSVKRTEHGFEYDLDLNEDGLKFMAASRKVDTPSISGATETAAQKCLRSIIRDMADDVLPVFKDWKNHKDPLVIQSDNPRIESIDFPKMKITMLIDFEVPK